MSEFKQLIERLIQFRDERDWKQFHNAKDLALAISIEAAELNELFLWKTDQEANSDRVKEELADVLSFCFLLVEKYGFDIQHIVTEKIEKNKITYPVEKARGTARKYNEI